MSDSFSPIRQILSRLISHSGLGKPVRFLYDKLIYSRMRATRQALSQKIFDEFELNQNSFQSLLDLLQPLEVDAKLVRLGGANDGGYLLPNNWKSSDALFSPGVAGSSSFEVEFANEGIPCFFT